jgi:hypothetical protein
MRFKKNVGIFGKIPDNLQDYFFEGRNILLYSIPYSINIHTKVIMTSLSLMPAIPLSGPADSFLSRV